MRHHLLKNFFLITLAFLGGISVSAQKTKRNLQFKINGLSNVTVYLAQYDGARLFYRDTTKVNALGEFEFGTQKPLAPGMYAIVTSNKAQWLDFLVNEPQIKLETDLSNFILHMKIISSEENKLLYQYLKLSDDVKNRKHYILKGRSLNDLTETEKAEIKKLENDVQNLRTKIYQEHPNMLVGLLMSNYLYPEIPEKIQKISTEDNNASFFYLKDHYFDLVNLKDDKLASLPSFQEKLDAFLDQIVFPHPDSLIVALDNLMSKTIEGSEVYQFIVTHALKKVFANKTIGMDAVFVHLAKEYIDPEKTKWMDAKKLQNLHERVSSMEPLLAGKTAPELKLPDLTGKKWVSLHNDFKTDFTILYFWRPDCSHCKEVTPILRDLYKKIDHSRVKVLAINTMMENDLWEPYIKENNLTEFTHVSDNEDINNNPDKYVPTYTNMESVKFRETYDIYSTPRLFLLDKDKKIIAKRMTPHELEEMLKILLKNHN